MQARGQSHGAAPFIFGPDIASPAEAVEYDFKLLDLVQRGVYPGILRVWVNGWCIVVGRNNHVSEWVDEDAAKAAGVPIIRRESGGGAVVHHPWNLNYSFAVSREKLGGLGVKNMPGLFLGIVLRALAHLDISAEQRGVSDIFAGGRKVSGNAARVKSRAVLHHGTLLLESRQEEMTKYLRIPPNRPGVPHEGFVAGLWELGYPVGVGRIGESIARSFAETFGWRVEREGGAELFG